jgi:hypothetical protein
MVPFNPVCLYGFLLRTKQVHKLSIHRPKAVAFIVIETASLKSMITLLAVVSVGIAVSSNHLGVFLGQKVSETSCRAEKAASPGNTSKKSEIGGI